VAITSVIRQCSWLGKLQCFRWWPNGLHIRPTRRQLIKSVTIFLYFHDNFLPTDNVFDGKANF